MPTTDELKIKELEEEIEKYKKQINQFKGLLDSIPDPVFMKDENLLWIYGNPVILNLYNIDPNDYVGKAENELLPAEFAVSCMKSDENARDSKVISKSEERARDSDYKLHYYEVFKVPFYENNIFRGLIGVGRDITETKETRIELEKALEHQKFLTQQSKMASVGEMMENIAHQWKQPLSSLSTITSGLLLKHQLGLEISHEEINHNMTMVLQNVEYMSNTIDDFRNFFKEDKEKQSFLLSACIDKSLTISLGHLKKYNIEIIKDFQNDSSIFGYQNELIQVLLNFISNAKDALVAIQPESRKITITLGKTPTHNIIEFSDNAGGIPLEIIDKIFDPHFTTKKEAGTGIGLYMSKMIIEKSFEGNIEVSNKDDGASFKLILPSL